MPELDSKTKDQLGPEQGEIPLFVRGAIGLLPKRDIISLYPIPDGPPYQKLLGLTFYFTAQGEGPAEAPISSILTATEFRVRLPGSAWPYLSEMKGWEEYSNPNPGYTIYKPKTLTLSDEDGDDIHFAILDQASSDPGFPFWQIGSVSETNKSTSPKHKWSLYRLGLNIPLPDPLHPGWAENLPSEAELFEMLKPGLWKGTYEVEVFMPEFIVEDGHQKRNYMGVSVQLGGAKYDDGQVSYVGGWYIGDNTKPWPKGIWMGSRLTILSGDAEGKEYLIVDNHVTGDDPPPGMPPNERLLEVLHEPGSIPESDGVKPGDYYKIQSHFVYNIEQIFEAGEFYEPGSYEAQTLKYSFEVE